MGGSKILNSFSCTKKRPDNLELVDIERRGVVIPEEQKKIQMACLENLCPIVVGQKGACYKIMRNIDRGSYG